MRFKTQGGPVDLAAGRCLLLEATPPRISSSQIRQILGQNEEPPPDVLSPAVYRYIRKNHLYEHNPPVGESGLHGH